MSVASNTSKVRSRRVLASAAAVVGVVAGSAGVATGQIMIGTVGNFITVSMAGLGGNATTVAGDARLPVLPTNVTYDATAGANATLHIRANSQRHTVRQIDLEVRGPRAARFDFGPQTGATMRVRLDNGPEMVAQQGRGNITILTMTPQRVTGSYEGTVSSGAVPVVIRGRFEVNLPAAAGAAGAARPMPSTPVPPTGNAAH